MARPLKGRQDIKRFTFLLVPARLVAWQPRCTGPGIKEILTTLPRSAIVLLTTFIQYLKDFLCGLKLIWDCVSTFVSLTRARRAEFCNCLFLRASCLLNIRFQIGCSQKLRNVSHLSFLLSGWSSGSAALNEIPSDFDLVIEGFPPWCSPSK